MITLFCKDVRICSLSFTPVPPKSALMALYSSAGHSYAGDVRNSDPRTMVPCCVTFEKQLDREWKRFREERYHHYIYIIEAVTESNEKDTQMITMRSRLYKHSRVFTAL